MNRQFTKMHGLGNDFVILDAREHPIELSISTIQGLSNRHQGIGFDQLLVLEKLPTNLNLQDSDIDFFYRIYNANGKEAEQCGNGARCIMRYVVENNLTSKKQVCLATIAGKMLASVKKDYFSIQVSLPRPQFEPERIPFRAPFVANQYVLQLFETEQRVMVVSMGNPHAVIQVDSLSEAPVEQLGHRISTHPDFPEGVNVGFMEIINQEKINLRVYERGCGETQACGSGACAAVVLGIINNLLKPNVEVCLPGGTLEVLWPGLEENILMTGPAVKVFSGVLAI
jgi:diaminopimelate epimerase